MASDGISIAPEMDGLYGIYGEFIPNRSLINGGDNDLSDLTTTNKKNLVAAINEVAAKATGSLSGVIAGIGDGTADDTSATSTANATYGFVRLPKGKKFRITSNTTIGNIISEGGRLVIDSGVTLSFDNIVGPTNVVVFEGAGIAKPRNHSYSVGWYAGLDLKDKWDFCRRAFNTSPRKHVLFPTPLLTDPAYIADEYGSPAWKTSKLVFDDPENNMTVTQQAPFVAATYGQDAVIEFSPLNKTEDHRWTGLHIDGADKALNGILSHGGARQQFFGNARITNVIDRPVKWLNDLWPADQLWFQELYIARYGDGVLIAGTGANSGGTNCLNNSSRIDRLIDNGTRGLGGTATVTAGAITAVTVPTAINGANQKRSGYRSSQVFYINTDGATGGYGATATATVDANGLIDLSSFVITAGGSGFTNNDNIVITTAQNVLKYQGWHTNPRLSQVYQNTVSPQAPVAGPMVLLETTSAGGVTDGIFQNIYSELRGKQMFVSTAGAGVTTVYHTYNLSNVRSIYQMQNTTLAPVEMGWVRDGNYSESTRQTNNGVYISVGNNSSNISFIGIPVERVNGVFNGFYFDGELVYFVTGRGTDSAGQSSVKPFSGFVAMKRVTLLSNTANVWGEFLIVDDNTLVTIAKGSLVETRNSAGLSGTTSTAGNFGLSISNGVLYHENRTGASVRYKIVVGR